MNLHDGNSQVEPAVDHPDAIHESGPYFVKRIADALMKELHELYAQFGLYLSEEDIRDIAI
jgi:hypothetical protein